MGANIVFQMMPPGGQFGLSDGAIASKCWRSMFLFGVNLAKLPYHAK